MSWFLALHLFHGLKGVLPQNDRDRCGGDHANFSDHHGDECAWCHIIHKVEQLQRDGRKDQLGRRKVEENWGVEHLQVFIVPPVLECLSAPSVALSSCNKLYNNMWV